MRVLVTGGAGFIGSNLADRLVAEGHDVTVVDNYSRGGPDNLETAVKTGQCTVHVMDLLDDALPRVMRAADPEVVFHLAAQIDVRASVRDPRADAMANVMGTIAVLDAARQADTRKVVLVSSVAIFGPPKQLPVTEDSEANPLSPYAASKLAAEYYMRQYQSLHDVRTTTLVLTNTYGPRQDPHGEAGVVSIFAERMLTGASTRVFGDGSNSRDYVYVDDVVDALVRAGMADCPGDRFVVGTGVPTTDLQLNRAVAAAVGGAREPEFAPPRLGDLPHMVVDASRLRERLGWVPTVPLAEGIARTVAALRGRLVDDER